MVKESCLSHGNQFSFFEKQDIGQLVRLVIDVCDLWMPRLEAGPLSLIAATAVSDRG